MFQKSSSNKVAATPTPESEGKNNQPPRVYVTSIKSIASSSPAKTNWLKRSSTPSTPTSTGEQSPAQRALRHLLSWPKLGTLKESISTYPDAEPVLISDSITNSNRLQQSIMISMLSSSIDEPTEVHCCKQDEA
eukprot:393603_1